MMSCSARIALGLASAALALAGTEWGARVYLERAGEASAPIELGWELGWDESDQGSYKGQLRDELYRPDAVTFFSLQPNLDLETSVNPRVFDLTTNALGLRSPEVPAEKSAGTLRILCLGDSCTFGAGAPIPVPTPPTSSAC